MGVDVGWFVAISISAISISGEVDVTAPGGRGVSRQKIHHTNAVV